MIYLDNSATTRVKKQVVCDMAHCMEEMYYNPSSLYAPAMMVEKQIEKAKDSILKAVHANNKASVYFTSGGTEADNLAIFGSLSSLREGKILYSAGEHPAVLSAIQHLKGFEKQEIPLNKEGLLDLEALENRMTPDVVMICVMHVNNETGAVMQLDKVKALKDKLCKNAFFHVDGVQGFLRVPFDFNQSGATSYALSGHKIHGPKGIGALVVKENVRIAPILFGGGQQKTVRPGTENVPGIVGLMSAIEHYENRDIRKVKCALYEAIKEQVGDIKVNGGDPYDDSTAPHIINISLEPVRSENMLHALEQEQVYVGIGSSCSSKSQKVSNVLKSMGVERRFSECALRFSLSAEQTEDEMLQVAKIIKKHYDFLKKYVRR